MHKDLRTLAVYDSEHIMDGDDHGSVNGVGGCRNSKRTGAAVPTAGRSRWVIYTENRVGLCSSEADYEEA